MIDLIGHLYPFKSGCGRLANLRFSRKIIDGLTRVNVQGRLRNGLRFHAPPSDFVGRAAWFFGDLDPKLTDLAQVLVREGDTVVDIGANFGHFSLYASQMVGPHGRVIAVEPQVVLLNDLDRSLRDNGIMHVHTFPMALGESNGILNLHVRQGNLGASSLVHRAPSSKPVPIPVQHSGSFLRALEVDRIRFLKLSAQGYEGNVIRGALTYLRRHSPDAIVVGVQMPRRVEENSALTLLTELGYQCFWILPSFRATRLAGSGYQGNLSRVHDVLAVAPGLRGVEVMNRLRGSGIRFV